MMSIDRIRRAASASLTAAIAVGMLTSASCAGGGAAPAGTPVADPEGAAAELQRTSLPSGPRQATFGWSLDEAGSRLQGRGVARYEAPDRIRLDLFGPRGETYLAAALVGDEFRVPEGLPGTVTLPSPALLWAAVGVVRPPADARVVDAAAEPGRLTIRYRSDGGESLELRAAGEPLRLSQASRSARTNRETLQLTWRDDGQLQSTRYRDLSAYRELVLTVEAMREVESFPPSIWNPDGAAP